MNSIIPAIAVNAFAGFLQFKIKRQKPVMKVSTIRIVLFILFASLFCSAVKTPPGKPKPERQKIVIIMFDGFGEEYYRNSKMPALNFMEKHGIYKVVPSLMPSVTNVNNASICTGELPEKNGITGNSFLNPATGTEDFMEDSSLLLCPTIFERAKHSGVNAAIFSSKKKTIGLLSKGTVFALSPETAPAEWIEKVGNPPSIYSREVNYWLMNAALYSMKHDSTIDLFYIHTTDYPMHTWAAEENESKEHLNKMDSLIGEVQQLLPGAMILITADHTVKHKNVCVDLEKSCAGAGVHLKMAISAERDKYLKHHRGFGGVSYVYLNNKDEFAKTKKTIEAIRGVEQVMSKEEAANKFHLMPERIGDLVVLADDSTVFGELDTERELLPANYRTHGSMYEAKVPLFIYNAKDVPAESFFSANYKIASWLFR